MNLAEQLKKENSKGIDQDITYVNLGVKHIDDIYGPVVPYGRITSIVSKNKEDIMYVVNSISNDKTVGTISIDFKQLSDDAEYLIGIYDEFLAMMNKEISVIVIDAFGDPNVDFSSMEIMGIANIINAMNIILKRICLKLANNPDRILIFMVGVKERISFNPTNSKYNISDMYIPANGPLMYLSNLIIKVDNRELSIVKSLKLEL